MRSDRAALGISMTMLGGLCFAIQDAGIKWLSAELAVPQFWLWQSPSPGEYLQLFAVAFFGVIAQFSVTKAYAVASPSLVAPFEYTALIWAALLGYLLWHDVPGLQAIAGAALIIGSGIYIIHREAIKAKA